MKQNIARLQFITPPVSETCNRAVLEEIVHGVLAAGVSWVQLRMKEASAEEWLSTGARVKKMCQEFGATLIVNDEVSIAKAIRAQGVHLGKSDMQPWKARKILGQNTIIGGTANTVEDCYRLLEERVDYIGLGPLRDTDTKKDLSPILGLHGLQHIVTKVGSEGVPLIAVGGIELSDMQALKEVGMYGVAVSSALSRDTQAANQFLEVF